MSQNSTIIRPAQFGKGPKIQVEVLMKGENILSSKLKLSNQFSCIGGTKALHDWLEAYAQRKSAPLFLSSGSPFQQKVMEALCKIPFGKTVSYQELAKMCGNPKGARAVGLACGKNPFPLFVPCHRVIQSNGKLGGFAYGTEIKKALLDFEN